MTARSFSRARTSVFGLMLATACLAIAGVLAMFAAPPGTPMSGALSGVCIVAFAAVAGFSLWVSMEATACAQVLGEGKGGHGWAQLIAWVCAIFTGLVSIAGAHLGYAVITEAPNDLPPMWAVDIGGLGLAFVKPGMSFVIEACVSADRIDVEARDLLLEARDQRIRELERECRDLREGRASAPSAPARSTGPINLAEARAKAAAKKKRLQQARAALAGGLAASVGVGDLAAAAEIANPTPIEESLERPQRSGYIPTMVEIEDARAALHRRGILASSRSVSRYLGCTRQRLAEVWPKGTPLDVNLTPLAL